MVIKFENNKKDNKVFEVLGFLFSYFLFTTVLYLIFVIIKKEDLTYIHFMAISLFVTLIGFSIKKVLK